MKTKNLERRIRITISFDVAVGASPSRYALEDSFDGVVRCIVGEGVPFSDGRVSVRPIIRTKAKR